MNPNPTSSVHRARSDGTLFTLLTHSENAHFAPALIQPLQERIFFGEFFCEVIALLPEYSFTPRQADHLIYALKRCSVLFLHV